MTFRFSGLIAGALAFALALHPAQAHAEPSPVAANTVPYPDPLSVESFARIPLVSRAYLSPDGNLVAGLFGVQGQQVLSIINLFEPNAKRIAITTPEGTQIDWLRWVNNENVVVGLSALQQIEGSERWQITRLVSVNGKTGKLTRLLWDRAGQNASDVLWRAHDGSSNILVAAQNSIYMDEQFWPAVFRVDVATGKSRQMVQGRPGIMDWSADASGIVRTGVSYDDDSRKFRLLYRGATDSSFSMIDRADARKRESLLNPFLFLPGTDHALAIHDDDAGHSAIFEVDLKTQADVRTVFPAPDGDAIDSVIMSADGLTLIGVRLESGKTHWFDDAMTKVQDVLDEAVGTRRAYITSLSDDRSRMLVVVDRPNSPGGLYFFNIYGEKMQRIAWINDALEGRTLGPVKLVKYTARDGLSIEAVLTLPTDRSPRNLPIVIMPHGGPWARDTADYDYWAQFIASRGYAVLQPNFRGSTGYGEDFLRAGEGQLGLAMQDDLTDALNWAAKEGIADPHRACIVGASYGGYAAMWGIAKDPDLYRCAISIAGVANLRREVNDFGQFLHGGLYRDEWKRMAPDFAAVSPINAVARIKAPLLLIHGKKDITVNFAQSTSMYNKMRDAGKTVEFVPLDEADHHYTREADRIVLLRSIEAFLQKYNPADPRPTIAPATKASR